MKFNDIWIEWNAIETEACPCEESHAFARLDDKISRMPSSRAWRAIAAGVAIPLSVLVALSLFM